MSNPCMVKLTRDVAKTMGLYNVRRIAKLTRLIYWVKFYM
jgi:hypothetical protein